MKYLLLAGFCLLVASLGFAQNQTLPEQLYQLHAPLDKTQCATGFLFDLAVPMAHPLDYRGVLSEENYTSIDVFGMLYGELAGSHVGASGQLPDPSVYLSKIRSLEPNSPIPLAIMAMRFDMIRPDAVDQNLLSYDGHQLHDVPGRPMSPYFQDTVYAAALLKAQATSQQPVFSLPADLWFTNLGGAMPAISIDAGDGQGWQTVTPGQNVQSDYAEAGTYEVKVRLEYAGFTRYAHCRVAIPVLAVQDRSGIIWPQNLYDAVPIFASKAFQGEAGGAVMHVFYNTSRCNTTKRMIRPLIIVEGFEAPGITSSDFNRMFSLLDQHILVATEENLTDYLYPNEYDLIYVNFNNGNDYIQRNAYVVEEVIKWVNAQKAAAGSPEQNVVIGVSMGGVCAKYALLDMQQNGPGHDTRLFITYDSPLNGANIPIGVQHMVKFLRDNISTYSNGVINSIPQLDAAWQAIQAPAPRQLLINHINGLPNAEQVALFAEIAALGALSMRHVALSNGAADGTAVNSESMVPGGLFFDLKGKKEFCKVIIDDDIVVILCGHLSFEFKIRATDENIPTEVFWGYLELDKPFEPKITTTLPVVQTSIAYDVMPGSSSNLGVLPLGSSPSGLTFVLNQQQIALEGPGLTATHHTFIPTFSSVSVSAPSTAFSGVGCATSRCTNPEVPVTCEFNGLPELNQSHILLDERIALVLIDELVTNSPLPIRPLWDNSTLDRYFNIGYELYANIPSLDIVAGNGSNGKLSINNSGKVAFAEPGDPFAPYSSLEARTVCNAIVNVEAGGKLVIGSDDYAKSGTLLVQEGTVVHVKSGGVLQITSNESKLVIQPGARLILDPGARVILESPESKISIEGELVWNGDIQFSGLGFFEFNQGHSLVFGPACPAFNLSGAGLQHRFIRLNAELKIPAGKGLNLQQGGLELIGGGIKLEQDNQATLDYVRFFGDVLSYAIFAQELTSITVTNSQFRVLEPFHGYGTAETGVKGWVSFLDCTFENVAVGPEAHRVIAMAVKNCEINCGGGPDNSFPLHGLYSHSAFYVLLENTFINGFSSGSFSSQSGGFSSGLLDDLSLNEGFKVEDTRLAVILGGEIAGFDIGVGNRNVSGTGGPSNIVLTQGATVRDCKVAIAQRGDALYGQVVLDCARLLNYTFGIFGVDATLVIDPLILHPDKSFPVEKANIFAADTYFAGIGEHLKVCYQEKNPPGSIPARFNFWGYYESVTNLLTVDQDPTSNMLVRKQPDCNTPVAVNVAHAIARAPRGCGEEFFVCQEEDCFQECEILPEGKTTGTVHGQYHEGLAKVYAADLAGYQESFQSVSALWESLLDGYNQYCATLIHSARSFTEGDSTALRSGKKQEHPALILWPNPTSGHTTLFLPAQSETVQVFDAQGQLKLEKPVNDLENLEIQTLGWPSGIYYIKVSGKAPKIGKLMVE